ncbi:MAG: RagB/SusD family nutrient uptake outer membrane protein [Tannerella sp.]|jgi:hypothetical protein|nr:RagB/SusD family nutrient uptake outer membrane protein [Tannerella sp.]
MKLYKFIISTLTGLLLLSACSEDYLEADNTGVLDSEKASELAAQDPESLNSYLRGVWAFMVAYNISGNDTHDDFSYMSVLHSKDMMCEDIVMMDIHWFNGDYNIINRMFNYRRPIIDWRVFYTMVAKANEIIGFFPEEPASASSKGLLGQGYAIRGMAYYYLIQIFQNPTGADGLPNLSAPGVPMLYCAVDNLSEEEQTRRKGRNTVKEVYDQIESDLTNAVKYLEAGYARVDNKIFIEESVANGLLARYYLLSQQWEKAAAAAKKAHSSYAIMGESDLHDGFMDITNGEWMWGFDHSTETQTAYASFFSHISNIAPGYAGIGYSTRGIDARLYSLISPSDYRKALFSGPDGNSSAPTSAARRSYASLKFGDLGDWTMDYVYMRAAEMVLIEAEAYAHLGRGAEAATTLKKLMAKRDPQWNETSVTVDDVYLQRRIELWGEGFSYFDLKRLNRGIDRNYAGSNHTTGYKHVIPAQDVAWTYQIPNAEMQENKQISNNEQNP